jgi:hypothetical protein
MKNAHLLLTLIMIGFCLLASPAQALVIKACDVENPPVNCENMWAVVAHVWLPKLPVAAVHATPRCESKFSAINWGKIVADAFNAEAGPDKLENLAMDVSDAFQKRTIPQITRHIQGDAGTFIENNFSRLAPRAWSPSWATDAYDRSFCAPVIAAVPTNATVRGFRYRAWDEHLGEGDCTAGVDCSIGYSRFLCYAAETSMGRITLYIATFQSWSTDSPREGRLIVFFEMPPGKLPVQQM